MINKQWSRALTGALMVMLLALAGCGSGQNDEVVYLHVFNAYPGASSMSLYGPGGVVVRDLPFGQRTPEPVAVDRNLGDAFILLLDGAPESFDTTIPVWSMYPHETATVLFKRRTGGSDISPPVLYRHVQTGYRTAPDGIPDGQRQQRCRMVMDNALAGASGSFMNMSYIPAFKVNPSCVGYKESIGSFDDPRGAEFIQQVANNPWFYPIEVAGDEVVYIKDGPTCPPYEAGALGEVLLPSGTFDFLWAGSEFSTRRFDETGNIAVPPTTGQLMECLGWDPNLSAGDQSDLLTPDALAGCLIATIQPLTVETEPELQYLEFPVGMGEGIPPGRCGFDVRADSDFESIFVGRNLDGSPVMERAEFAPNQYYFWVLYGRPVNPLVESWGSNEPEEGGGFVDLPPYPGESSTGGQ